MTSTTIEAGEAIEWGRMAARLIGEYADRVERAEPEAWAEAKTVAEFRALFERHPLPLALGYALHRAGFPLNADTGGHDDTED